MAETLDDGLIALGLALDGAAGVKSIDKLEKILADAQARLAWPQIYAVLLDRVQQFDTPRDRLALVLHATDLDIAEVAVGKGEMAGVFEVLVAAADTAAMDLFLSRAEAVLESTPSARRDLPTVLRLIEIANQVERQHEQTGDALVGLAQRIEDLNEADAAADD